MLQNLGWVGFIWFIFTSLVMFIILFSKIRLEPAQPKFSPQIGVGPAQLDFLKNIWVEPAQPIFFLKNRLDPAESKFISKTELSRLNPHFSPLSFFALFFFFFSSWAGSTRIFFLLWLNSGKKKGMMVCMDSGWLRVARGGSGAKAPPLAARPKKKSPVATKQSILPCANCPRPPCCMYIQ